MTPFPLVGGGLIVDVNDISAEGVDISSLALRASGDEGDQTVSLQVKGKPVGADLSVRGRFDREKGWKGALYASSITTPVGPWKLVDDVPINVDIKTSEVDVGAFCWAQNQSRVCLDKPVKVTDKGQAQVSIDKFNLDILQSFLPITTTISGSLNADASIGWKPNALPTVNATVTLPKGQVTEQLDAPLVIGWNNVYLNTVLADDKLTAKLLLDLTDNAT